MIPVLSPPNPIEEILAAQHGLILATILGAARDFDLASAAVDRAREEARARWSADGVPERPSAWLLDAARGAALEGLRNAETVPEDRDAIARDLEGLSVDAEIADERLSLLLLCCHPALPSENRIALTLHAVSGFPAAAIARLFFLSEATIAQRIVRAKAKIASSRLVSVLPGDEAFEARLDLALAVVWFLFTEGFAGSVTKARSRVELSKEAIRLGRMIVLLRPTHAESRGLLALMLLEHARRATRVDQGDDVIPFEDQDRSKWNAALVAEGTRMVDEAIAEGVPGPYQVQAAIAALHAAAARAEDTDWAAIVERSEELFRLRPSQTAGLGLAFALGMARGPAAGLFRLDALIAAGALADDVDYYATRGELLFRIPRYDDAARAFEEALGRAPHPRERRFLTKRAVAAGKLSPHRLQ